MNTKSVKKMLFTVFCMLLVMCESILVSAKEPYKTASEAVEEISIGWNLGNTFDCCNKAMQKTQLTKEAYYEKLWGNPTTTKQMIDTVKEAGFNAVRIPVTWYNHVNEQGQIDIAWLDRIAEIVNDCLNNDMYVILNMHHDTGYGNKIMQANQVHLEAYQAYATLLWSQVAEYFKNYDERVMFESFNELLDMSAKNPWYGNEDSWQAMNMLNQTFVDVVRQSGGLNANRNLIVNTYGAQTTYGPLSRFQMPDDTVPNHLIAEVHYFGAEIKPVQQTLREVNKYLVQKGYPVIIGEFGTNRYSGMEYRVATAVNYVVQARQYGIKCFWWDDGGDYELLNRKNCTWKYPDILAGLLQAAY